MLTIFNNQVSIKRTDLTLPAELHKRLKGVCNDRQITMKEAIHESIYLWLSKAGIANEQPPTASANEAAANYRPENIPWHDRMEIALNSPETRSFIQMNLEVAEKLAGSKLTQPRPAGKRASGE